MNYFKLSIWLIAISLCVIIFKFSAQPAYVSRVVSFNTTQKIVELLPQTKGMTIEEKDAMALRLDSTVRKYAHFFLYFCFGMSVVAAAFLTIGKQGLLKSFLLALLFCLLYAISDEIHQIFVPGRGCQFRDVMIDFIGSFLGSLLVVVLIKIKRNYTKKKLSTNEQ